MFTHRNYLYKRTRQGGTVRCCRESYLREEIPCGLSFCAECAAFSDSTSNTLLSTKVNSTGMLCILDYRTILNQLAFVEAPDVVDVIIPQSVVDYIKVHDVNIYRRINECLDNKDKRFFEFFNEFHIKTSCVNSHLTDDSTYLSNGLISFIYPYLTSCFLHTIVLVSVANWYHSHLQTIYTSDDSINAHTYSPQSPPKIIILTTDVSSIPTTNLSPEVSIMSVEEYASIYFRDRSPETFDRILLENQSDVVQTALPPSIFLPPLPQYTPHLSLSELQLELGKRRLLQGFLRVNPLNQYEAFIVSRNFPVQIIVHGSGLCYFFF